MRSDATLVKDFDSFPDKNLAWDCLIKLANDKDSNVQWRIARLLSIFFLKVPEKYKAWKDLISLLDNRNPIVRRYAVRSLGLAYSYVSDKTETWEYLHKLTKNKSVVLREGIAHSLGYAFPYTSYKQQAWEDILEMTSDENRNIRLNASKSLVSSVVYVPDKRQAWNDLTKLTRNQDKNIRWYAARSFGSIFTDMPDKQKAWKDLVEMTKNEDKHIQGGAIHSIECAYSYVHDEQEAWEDLVKIADKNDKDISLQINHLLGKICINKASQSKNEEEYKKELENAIGFFEKAYTESSYFSPSKFCLPFYRSFYTIIFSERQQQAEKIVDKYLSDAKNAIGSSENKKLLLEAVKNLADALKEVQNLQKMDFDTKKKELNFYRKYCEQTAELMNETEKAAPYVTIVIRKGLPILDRNLKTLLEEIKEKAKTACLGSKGTRTEVIACAVSREVQKWEIGSQEEMTQKVEDVAYLLKTKVVNLPENEYVLNKIEAMRHERDINRQYEALLFVIGQIPTMKVVSEQDLDHKFHKLDLVS